MLSNHESNLLSALTMNVLLRRVRIIGFDLIQSHCVRTWQVDARSTHEAR